MSPDFRDLLSTFNAHRVEYLVVGAHALAAHGHVRATGDLDVWVRPTPENAKRVLAALGAFGAPLQDLVDLPVPVLSARHLIRNKRAVGRPQDLADIHSLEQIKLKE
jgi:hypothetical protein